MSRARTMPLCLILQPAGPEAPDAVAVVTRNAPVDAAFLDRHPALKVIAKHGAGLDNIDVAEARRRGIAVIFTPGANAHAVAEHALALILALAKRLRPADRAVRGDDFAYKFRARFDELSGLRLGIVGLGDSGRRLAHMASAGLGMRVAAYSPSVPQELFETLRVERSDALMTLLATSDVVSLHVPARPGARGMIGPAELAVLPPGALLVSVGRGGVVDEAALADAVAAGHLGGAALDVFDTEPPLPDNPVFGLENVILTPHVAGNTEAALRRMALGVATQIIDVLAGRPAAHPAPWKREDIMAVQQRRTQARTVAPTPGDNACVHLACSVALPGEVVVVAAGGNRDVAMMGEMITRQAMLRNLGGLVVDGAVRDVGAIRAFDMPVFACGSVPRGPHKDYGGVLDTPVSVGGVARHRRSNALRRT